MSVCGIKEVDAGLEADVDQALGLGRLGRTPFLEKLGCAAKGAGAKAESGNFEAGASQKTIFHAGLDAVRVARMQERKGMQIAACNPTIL